MNLKEIKELITLMNENSLGELEIERDGMRIKLRKTAGGGFEQVAVPIAPQAPHAQQQAAEAEAKAAEASKKFIEIKSPMVGTFYRAPSPESPPYVDTGSDIKEGQVLCIVEAMKLMNEIKSEVKGKIVNILVDNAQPIEFGQVLFLVDPK
ncbi:MAG: acetyl-CoA carboxylase biotin carboxyl carrier protein [Candidatus Omnitrophota bacterium]